MSRIRRSQEELKEALKKHVMYEIEMFYWSVSALAKGEANTWGERNSQLETFALHTRNLVHFFYPENARDDDMIAEDFFADPASWRRTVCPSKNFSLGSASGRVNKEVAHLTYARLGKTDEEWNWRPLEIVQILHPVIQKFLEGVRSFGVDASFIQEYADLFAGPPPKGHPLYDHEDFVTSTSSGVATYLGAVHSMGNVRSRPPRQL